MGQAPGTRPPSRAPPEAGLPICRAPAHAGSGGEGRVPAAAFRPASSVCPDRTLRSGMGRRAVRRGVMREPHRRVSWPVLISGLAAVSWEDPISLAVPLPGQRISLRISAHSPIRPSRVNRPALSPPARDTGMSGVPWEPWLAACYPEKPEGSGKAGIALSRSMPRAPHPASVPAPGRRGSVELVDCLVDLRRRDAFAKRPRYITGPVAGRVSPGAVSLGVATQLIDALGLP